MQVQEQYAYQVGNDEAQSSGASSDQEIAQQMLMQEQFAAYEHHLQL